MLSHCNISSLAGTHPAWYAPRVTTLAPPAPHQFAILIDPADIDFMGHVNNASYLKWVQDAVVDHWRALAPAEDVARHLWVALKHEITYRRPTFANDLPIAHVVLDRDQARRSRAGRSYVKLVLPRCRDFETRPAGARFD